MYKSYQERIHDTLIYFASKAEEGVATVFTKMTGKPYRAFLGETPVICVQSGTGSGKTLMATRAIGAVSDHYLAKPPEIVLILVPSDTLKEQTLADLRNPSHINHRALIESLGENFTVADINDCLHLTEHSLEGRTHVICSTVAMFNVNDTLSRDVYKGREGGLSLAGLIAATRPLIIVDEAHLNRTELFQSVLEKLHPSFVMEWTATPRNNNQIANVELIELKQANMVKFPMVVQVNGDGPEGSLAECIIRRAQLEQLALGGDRPIRPIALIGANIDGSDHDVDAVVALLTREHNIPRNQIAIATGKEDELLGIDLESPACEIRFVVTINKLREGWNCPWCYCYCSMREIGSETAKEQYLGRICRLPNATPFTIDELNQSYVFAYSDNFNPVLNAIADGLERCGYTQEQARSWVVDSKAAPKEQIRIELPADVISIPDLDGVRITIGEERSVLEIDPDLPFYEMITALEVMEEQAKPEHKPVFTSIKEEVRRRCYNFTAPSESGAEFPSLPQIYLDTGLGTQLVTKNTLSHLLKFEHVELPKMSYEPSQESRIVVIDVNDNNRRTELPANLPTFQKDLLLADKNPTNMIGMIAKKVMGLISRTISDISYSKIHRWVKGFIDDFVVNKSEELIKLLSNRNRIARHFADRLILLRRERVVLIFNEQAKNFHINGVPYPMGDPKNYRPTRTQASTFSKHFFPVVGELNFAEERWARKLDADPQVKYWIRNEATSHERTAAMGYAFFLPIPDGRFFPDFVVLMADDKIRIDEYKGEMLVDSDDTAVKKRSGELWAGLTGNAFRIVTKEDL